MELIELKEFLGKTDMYLLDLLQKGYFDRAGKMIDIGSGSGRNINLFRKLNWEILAVDQNPSVFDTKFYTTHSNRIQIRVGELGQLPQTIGTYDLVVCNAVLHFAQNLTQFKSMVEDLVRLAGAKGLIFCRMVTSDTLSLESSELNKVHTLLDGSNRFVVDFQWLIQDYLPSLGLQFLETPKTVNVAGLRSMTTLVMESK